MREMKLTPETKLSVIEYLESLPLDKKAYVVQVKEYRAARSGNQNSLYWKWIYEIAGHISDATGEDTDTIHEYIKRNFLAPKETEVFGEKVVEYTTKDLTTKEMAEYMEKIEAWSSYMFGISLPHPEDLHKRE